jgi:predicted nucleic acid-binding protein
MRGVVSNATPLIYLAKAGKIDLLKTVFGQVFIPEEVKVEVVDRGKLLGQKDAYVVENAISEGWIKVLATDPVEIPIELDKGEEAALSLAKKQKLNIVLVDEVSARSAAKLLGLTPRGTLFVLLEALKRKEIELDNFLEILEDLINQGLRLREEVYVETVKEARKIAAESDTKS